MHSCSRCRRWGVSQLVSVGLRLARGAHRVWALAGRQSSLELLVSLLGGDLPQTHMCPPLSCLLMQKIKLIGWLGQEALVSVTQGSVIEGTSALVVWRDSNEKSLWLSSAPSLCKCEPIHKSRDNPVRKRTLFLYPCVLVFSWQPKSLAQARWWTLRSASSVWSRRGRPSPKRPRKTSSNKPSSSTSGSRKGSSNTPSITTSGFWGTSSKIV